MFIKHRLRAYMRIHHWPYSSIDNRDEVYLAIPIGDNSFQAGQCKWHYNVPLTAGVHELEQDGHGGGADTLVECDHLADVRPQKSLAEEVAVAGEHQPVSVEVLSVSRQHHVCHLVALVPGGESQPTVWGAHSRQPPPWRDVFTCSSCFLSLKFELQMSKTNIRCLTKSGNIFSNLS